ncbi:MAG TPA: MFS transporter [Elusimicrobiales bacterium]|nr:MFS transporter [Elusimicrobiales bacterium]
MKNTTQNSYSVNPQASSKQSTNPTFMFSLLLGINLFNYIDRQILYSVFPLIKKDLMLSDTQLGFLSSAFMIVYMLYSPIAGYFGDRHKRPPWIAVSTILWSIATFFSGIIKSFHQLLFVRSMVGIGEGGYMTMAPGYISEQFPKQKRARILSYFSIAIPIGSALGYLLGGQLGEIFGWRKTFFIVAIPGIILGLLVFKLKDPNREFAVLKKSPPKFKNYFPLLTNKVFIFTSLSQAMATFTLGGLAAWMPTYFHRYLDFSVARAGTVFGAITLFAGAIGMLAGGRIADFLLKRTHRAYFIVSSVGFFLSIPAAFFAIFTGSKTLSIIMFFFAIAFVFVNIGPLLAAIVGSVSTTIRSMALAVNIFVIHAFGDAISPTVIGAFSDKWGLKTGIVACICMLAVAGFFSIVAGLYSKKEIEDTL